MSAIEVRAGGAGNHISARLRRLDASTHRGARSSGGCAVERWMPDYDARRQSWRALGLEW